MRSLGVAPLRCPIGSGNKRITIQACIFQPLYSWAEFHSQLTLLKDYQKLLRLAQRIWNLQSELVTMS